MRIHGDKVITRSREIKPKSDYHAYLPELQEDFKHICGYCGKSEAVAKNAFEIDHFVPEKYAKNRKNDYTNLVYSCFECNRKKSDKWLSEDPNIQFVDERGFVDPASGDYDVHLERSEDGNIVGKTPPGEYMVLEGFKFAERPVKEVWKAMQLIEKKKKLQEKMQNLPENQLKEYIILDMELQKIQEYLFGKKE